MSKVAGIFLAVLLCVHAEHETNVPENVKAWNPAFSLGAAFHKAGFSTEEISKIQARFFKNKANRLETKRWPFTNHGKELLKSITNIANNHAGEISEAITQAGGDPSDVASLSDDVQGKTMAVCQKKDADAASSLLQSSAGLSHVLSGAPWLAVAAQSEANFVTVQAISTSLSLTSASVASNTAALGQLSYAVSANAAAINGLGQSVAALSQVTGPTISLAATLGLPINTVASLALAGSFVGPLLGVMALVYVAWPTEDAGDPWVKIEARVSKMLTQRFDEKRRTKLGQRMKRYVKRFSQCSQAWVGQAMVRVHGVSVPKWIYDEAQAAKAGGGEFNLAANPKTHEVPAPRCMGQLEGHMSIERDEWYGTETQGMSGLFMPFANMHTQILQLLADNPYDSKMQWGTTLKVTSAEYGNYMLKHLLVAWKAQVCRSMRLRHSLKNTYWRYNFVVLKEVHQPNAAEECLEKCGGKTGWCNFCGGKNEGACCKRGDGGVCAKFDVPLTWGTLGSAGSPYNACVQTDCIQRQTGYYGKELKKFEEGNNGGGYESTECQQLCQGVPGAVAFTLNSQGLKCTCLAKEGLTRHKEDGAFSGPTTCPKVQKSLFELEESFANNTVEILKVPIEEVEACPKSPTVSNFAELEKTHPDWIQQCYRDAGKVVVGEYNLFYQRFAHFVDGLVWKAGCGAQHEVKWVRDAKYDGFLQVAKEFNGGTFAECNWDREDQLDKDMWVFDETRARGWTGNSRVNMEEQKKVKMPFPMPSWLNDLRRAQKCLKSTASGHVENADDARSTAVETIMGPAQDEF